MKIIYLIAYFLLCTMITLAQPQQSEHFQILKSVLDAAGASSTSTDFRLTSAVGQPTPIGVQSSAHFVLYAGFLEPTFQLSPVSPIQQLVIKRVGSDMRLWWEPISGAESYRIYRDVTSVFTPTESNRIGSVSDTFFADAGVVSLPPVQYFYIVTAVNEHNDPVASQGAKFKQKDVGRMK